MASNSVIIWHKIYTAPFRDDILGWDRENGTYTMRRRMNDHFESEKYGEVLPECWTKIPEPVQHYDVDGGPFIDVD